MLNFQSGNPIALVRDGDFDGDILYISTNINQGRRRMLHDSDDSDSDSDSEEEDEKYISLEEGHFLPLPPEDKRETILIAGRNGSGKSVIAAEYARTYLAMFPGRQIIGFSRTEFKNDPAYRGLNIIQVPINESIIKNPIDITKELTEPCLVIFDDVTTIQETKWKKNIDKLIADTLECGRKLSISVLFANHLIIDNAKGLARTVLNEIDKLVVFPVSGNPQQIKYALGKYFEYTDKQVSKMLKTDSRWLLFNKEHPKYVLSEYECYIPDKVL